jgi:hypothetical protein
LENGQKTNQQIAVVISAQIASLSDDGTERIQVPSTGEERMSDHRVE